MWRYAISRVLEMIPVLLGISFLVFSLSYLIPGDPVMYFLASDESTLEDYDRIFKALGLDKPMLDQYWDFITGAIVGDFGVSFESDEPVAPLILSRLPNTIRLALFSILISSKL